MADIPRSIVIKPVVCSTYVCYDAGAESGHVYCNGKSVFDPFTKIELEQSKKNTKFYNLRFCQSNRYWAKCKDDKWIAAVSKQPDEDTSKSSCTLFQPTIDSDGFLRLNHVQSGIRVQTDSSSARMYLDQYDKGDQTNSTHSFTYNDWDELVMIPDRVVFRGDNGKILKSVTYGDLNYLQFASTDGNDGYSAQAVSLQPDGHLRIKSEYYGMFWRLSPSWIWGDSSDESGSNVDTLFWPVKVDSKTIGLRNAGNNKFVKRLTADNKTECLNAAVSDISNEAKLIVEELVLESTVYNVKFRMEDARVFDEQAYLAGVGTATNDSDKDSSLTVKVSYEETESSSFTHSYSLSIGAKTTIETGIPGIVEGKVEVSADVTGTIEWGSTTTTKQAAEASLTVTVPAKSRVKVSYVGTHGHCSVPFSYTQKDKRSGDGKFVTSDHNDGIFHGANYYSFRFDQPAIEPL